MSGRKVGLVFALVAAVGSIGSAQTLKNPDFSTASIADWTFGDTSDAKFTASYDATVGNVAPGSMKMVVTKAVKDKGALAQQLMEGNMVVGDSMVLSGYLKSSRAITAMQVAIQVADSRACLPTDISCSGWHWDLVAWKNYAGGATTSWSKFSIPFDRGNDTVNAYQVMLIVEDTATVWFDDFSIAKKSSTVVSPLSRHTVFAWSSSAELPRRLVDIRGRIIATAAVVGHGTIAKGCFFSVSRGAQDNESIREIVVK